MKKLLQQQMTECMNGSINEWMKPDKAHLPKHDMLLFTSDFLFYHEWMNEWLNEWIE